MRRGMMARMTSLTIDLTYPGATVDRVAAMLADPAFREEVAARQHVLSTTVTVTPDGAGMVVVQDNVHATEGVPGFARKIVGDSTTIHSVERWSSPSEGHLEITIPGKPGILQGPIRLTQDGDTVVEHVDLAITVNIPLVGGKIAGVLEGLIGKALRRENEVGRDWLAR